MLNLTRVRDALLGRHGQGGVRLPSLNSQSHGAARLHFDSQQNLGNKEEDVFFSAFE
jgi:hypothetical protein